MKFTDLFIKRPVLAMVVSLLILLVGVRSLQLLNVRQYPQSNSAVVTVSTVYTGASADLIKGFITSPLEGQIASADGIDYLESSSLPGVSIITAHLKLNFDPNIALTQITSKVNQVRNQLPAGSEDPTIDAKVGETTSSMYLSFSSEVLNSNQITDYLARVVQPKLATVSGVQQARILGAHTFAMRIWLKPGRMAALDVTPAEVRDMLAANNALAAVGSTKGAAVTVTLTAATSVHTAEEFRRLVVKRAHGATIRLEDIADVVLGSASYDTKVTFNGQNATFVGIDVLPTANPLTVINLVRKILPGIGSQLPIGIKMAIPYDATTYIHDAIFEVERTLGETLIIVVMVIFLFLGALRSVVIPVIAMPLSLIGAAFVMLVFGFSINLLTLLAMVLAIGLVVDDAIVVVENIHRHIENGTAPMRAALEGARELGTPVIAMSITLIAVYAPIGFIGGLTGSLFVEFAFTLAGAVFVSGVVALTLSPMMCSRMLKADTGKQGFAHWLDINFERLRSRYERLLHGSLNYRPVTLLFAAVVLVSCYFLFITAKRELAPPEDQGFMLVQATGAPNASLDQTVEYTRQINRILAGFPEIENIFLLNGVGNSDAVAPNSALAGLVLKPWSERTRSPGQLVPLVSAKLAAVTAFRTAVFAPPALPGAGGGLPVQFVIGSTDDPLQIDQVSQALLARARQSGLFIFIDSDLKYDKAQAEIHINRDKAADLGLSMRSIANELGTMLGGGYVNRFDIQGRSYEVIPQVQRADRINPDQLRQFHVRAGNGELVPLSAVVSIAATVEPQQLNRFQQFNSATLSGVPQPGVSVGQALDFLRAQAAQLLPTGYSVDYAGASRQFVQEGSALILTFFFALIVIYLILAALFESFRDPFIVLVSVPMSISGALIFLSLGLSTVNIYTEVGLITLIGLISKHGILIVRFANDLQEIEGLDKRAAVEKAAGVRLRPILMTTAAMVLGVVPLILASGAGAASRFDIGLVIATGMSIGTLFTLFVVPTMYTVLAHDRRSGASTAADLSSVPQSGR